MESQPLPTLVNDDDDSTAVQDSQLIAQHGPILNAHTLHAKERESFESSSQCRRDSSSGPKTTSISARPPSSPDEDKSSILHTADRSSDMDGVTTASRRVLQYSDSGDTQTDRNNSYGAANHLDTITQRVHNDINSDADVDAKRLLEQIHQAMLDISKWELKQYNYEGEVEDGMAMLRSGNDAIAMLLKSELYKIYDDALVCPDKNHDKFDLLKGVAGGGQTGPREFTLARFTDDEYKKRFRKTVDESVGLLVRRYETNHQMVAEMNDAIRLSHEDRAKAHYIEVERMCQRLKQIIYAAERFVKKSNTDQYERVLKVKRDMDREGTAYNAERAEFVSNKRPRFSSLPPFDDSLLDGGKENPSDDVAAPIKGVQCTSSDGLNLRPPTTPSFF